MAPSTSDWSSPQPVNHRCWWSRVNGSRVLLGRCGSAVGFKGPGAEGGGASGGDSRGVSSPTAPANGIGAGLMREKRSATWLATTTATPCRANPRSIDPSCTSIWLRLAMEAAPPEDAAVDGGLLLLWASKSARKFAATESSTTRPTLCLRIATGT
jgi:hypothetical protein